MNREEIKKVLPLLQAVADGKKIRFQDLGGGDWAMDRTGVWTNHDLKNVADGSLIWEIIPEPKYRPWTGREALGHQVYSKAGQGRGGLITEVGGVMFHPGEVLITGWGWTTLDEVLECFDRPGGDPCGVEVAE